MDHQTIELSNDPNVFYDEICKIRKNADQQYPFSISCNDILTVVRDPIQLDYLLIGINFVIESSSYFEGERLREIHRWVPCSEIMPNNREEVEIAFLNGNKKRVVTVAEYIAPRTVLAEDYIDDDYCEFSDYDETTDTYWTPGGFYENQIMPEINWFFSLEVTHWRPLSEPPVKE